MIDRKFFLGFIRLHILHHAKSEPFFGLWMIEELKSHGYQISPGTLYPILHNLESDGFIKGEKRNINGKIRKYYSITKSGRSVLIQGTKQAQELLKELME
jgi:DNA-binding PadR family transcriptional regulator